MRRFDRLGDLRRRELEQKARLRERQDRVVNEWLDRLDAFLQPLMEPGPLSQRERTRVLLAIWEEIVRRYLRYVEGGARDANRRA